MLGIATAHRDAGVPPTPHHTEDVSLCPWDASTEGPRKEEGSWIPGKHLLQVVVSKLSRQQPTALEYKSLWSAEPTHSQVPGGVGVVIKD